ncbi:efflux RND transporter permease subunit [Pseudoalteromonas viridis]|uniref:Efflux RND transporter permease subunit n=1 Tax=Pseudoalteromonas viridis TaxID=339617 RepID=A0ABX7VD18_9GAMM|nr:efflux RND transporter permease subunit [Pseudoalteromonas viridis]QTL36454.1 efflux RND transporter permease subunit [Pseudoalteromonas viridis]
MNLKQFTSLVLVCALACVALGAYHATTLKNALLPPISKPLIMLVTSWQGKGADEIEQTLIAPLEQQLKSINGLTEFKTTVLAGSAYTKLYFPYDADMDKMYLEVLSQINQVPTWPTEVSPPQVINKASGANSTLASAMLYSPRSVSKEEFIRVMTNLIEPELTKISGIARLEKAFNNTEQRVDISFDPQKLANFDLTTDAVGHAMRNLKDQSGDQLTIGSREYSLHFNGQLTIDELKRLPIAVRQGHIVRLEEVAQIEVKPLSKWGYASFQGHRAFYFTMEPTPNVDALSTIAEVKAVFASLNEGALKQHDMQISLSRDDSKSIHNALNQVYGNLLLGVLLACGLLIFFFRNSSAVMLIFLAVPVCLALVVIGMKLGDYSLNVISLAGMALSIGLLLDAAIIVIDNIFRLVRQGLPVERAISRGTKEVSGAIISSTLSSIIIFVPIIMMESAEAQLFIDLAFTISSALMASVVVALVVLPAAARKLIKGNDARVEQTEHQPSRWVTLFTAPARSRLIATAILVLCLPMAIFSTYFLAPNFDVLPSPSQNNVNAIVLFNEPLTHEVAEHRIAQTIYNRIDRAELNNSAPDFEVYGMFCNTGMCQVYFYPRESGQFDTFRNWISNEILHDLPGTVHYVMPGNLLSFALPDNRVIELNLKGDTLPRLQEAGREILSFLQNKYPEAKITEDSPLYNRVPRIEFTPKQENLVHLGLTPAKLNEKLVALTDGVYLGHFFAQGNALPMYLKGRELNSIEALLDTEIAIPGFGLVPLHHLADVKMSQAPAELLRVNGETTVALEIEPPEGAAIGQFLSQIKQDISEFIGDYENQNIYFSYMGSADNLTEFLKEFLHLLIISVITLTVLMWLTLKSWRMAIAVVMSLPLAAFGGMLALVIIDMVDSQNLDIITMIGFIILFGLVINNAILLVSQFQRSLSEGLSQQQAIVQAVTLRRRPIYMSTGTSILGMLPLMLIPGEGAEIYRGLAAVIVGGMTLSALLSLSFMSALLSQSVFAKKEKEVAEPALSTTA